MIMMTSTPTTMLTMMVVVMMVMIILPKPEMYTTVWIGQKRRDQRFCWDEFSISRTGLKHPCCTFSIKLSR
jgi:hypothetical protein